VNLKTVAEAAIKRAIAKGAPEKGQQAIQEQHSYRSRRDKARQEGQCSRRPKACDLMKLIVDANVIISAVLKNGRTRELLLDDGLDQI
jgi:hypothetical protein